MTALSTETYDCRLSFAETLAELAEEDPRIVAVVNDSVGSSKLGDFKKAFPDRLVNVGIAEQNMVGVGAGLANGGYIPFVSAAACFLTARAMEQIKADVSYSDTNVKLIGQSSGIAYGELGPTHHSIEDVAWLRLLPNLTILVPSDPWQTSEAIRAAAAHRGGVFVRVSRHKVPRIERPEASRFEIGKAQVLRDGGDAAILANGIMLPRALEAADRLAARGIEARVLDMCSVAPLDTEAVIEAAGTGAVVTVEEGSVRGGLGGAVAEVLAARRPVPMRVLGFPGYQPTGSVDFLLEQAGLTPEGIEAAVEEVRAAREAA